jgi:hypothetical protein
MYGGQYSYDISNRTKTAWKKKMGNTKPEMDIDSTTGNAPRQYVGRLFVHHI